MNLKKNYFKFLPVAGGLLISIAATAQNAEPPKMWSWSNNGSDTNVQNIQGMQGTNAVKVQAANPTGTWVWRLPGRHPGENWTNTLVLKLVGEKLTGILTAANADGVLQSTPVEEAKLEGNRVSFKVAQWLNPPEMGGQISMIGDGKIQGNVFTNTYSGTIGSGRIIGQVTAQRGDDEMRSFSWRASRARAHPRNN
jgi:hypothetical protein